MYATGRRGHQVGTWKLFPIAAGTKIPALSGDWHSHATDDEAQIDAWIACGHGLAVDCEASGLMVIDIDGEQGEESFRTLQDKFPPTYEMRSRSGGRHLYYAGSGPSSVSRLAPKIDTRSIGGYVVWDAPDYFLLHDRPVASLPNWVVPALNARKDNKAAQTDSLDDPHAITRALKYLEGRAPAIEGQGGNDHTYQTAAALRDLGISEDKSAELLLTDWNERCSPPWDADELKGIINHAWEYGQNEAGAQAVVGDPRNRFCGADVPGGSDGGDLPSRYRLWSIAEVLERPKPTWIFPGVMPRKFLGLAFGLQETGKTWLILDMALRIAAGLDLSGQVCREPEHIVYFCGEGFEDLVHSRVQAWRAYHDFPTGIDEHFHLLENFPDVADDMDVGAMVNEITKRCSNPALIVLDTYARVLAEAGLSENDPLDVMKFVRQAESLKRKFGCTVLAIHHSGKDIDRGARGSNSLLAAVDFAFEICANWEAMALQLTCGKMKMARHFAPLFYEAVPVGESLAVRGITAAAHRALTVVEDPYSSRVIGAALARLGAVDDKHGVTTYVLASALHSAVVGEPEAEVQATIERIVRKLDKMAKGRLEQYVSSAGWHFPTA